MAFTITSMQRRPDIGFRTVRRHTAAGAKELVVDLIGEGAIDIEVRDDRGDLCDWRELGDPTGGRPLRERDVLKRLAPTSHDALAASSAYRVI